MAKPYAVWHWQGSKPAKSFCWLCWEQFMRKLATKRNDESTIEHCAKLLRSVLIAKSRPTVWMMRLAGFKVGQGVIVQTIQLPWNRPKSLTVGDNAQICNGACLSTGPEGSITIGDRSGVGRYNSICAYGNVSIGAGCLLSDWIHISDAEHIDGIGISPIDSGLRFSGKVSIGNRCFIGRLSTILPGSIIGDDCIVGACSLVNKEFSAGSVISGTPATLKRSLCA